MAREIPLSEFIEGVDNGTIIETVFVGNNVNRVYGKSVKGMSGTGKLYDLLWSKVP